MASIHLYGLHAVDALLTHRPEDALELLVQEGRSDDKVAQLESLASQAGVSVQRAAKHKLEQLCQSAQHQGVVLKARPLKLFSESDLVDLVQDNSLFLILDGVTDPQNFGACVRSAAAMGVQGVVFTKNKASAVTAAVHKVAAGGCELVQMIQVTNLARSIELLQQAGVFVTGTTLAEGALPIQHCDLTGKAAVVMGSEGEGLRSLTAKRCDYLGFIPMSGHIQSLNVSVATGMVLYEAQRQRTN